MMSLNPSFSCHGGVFTVVVLGLMFTIVANGSDEVTDGCHDNKSPCTCEVVPVPYNRRTQIKINCSNVDQRLTEVPLTFPTRTAILDLSNNRLEPNNIRGLCKYGHLKHVNLAHNHLSTIPADQFEKCFITDSMNFSGNTFEAMDEHSVKGLGVILSIYGLEARRFSESTLVNLRKLTVLEIIFHQDIIPSSMFINLKLFALNVDFQRASTVPVSLLDSLGRTLRELTIKGLFIHHLPDKLLHKLEHLEVIVLNFRDMHSIPVPLFQSTSMYYTLRQITCTGIRSVQRGAFDNLEWLRNLELHGADDLPSSLFKGLFKLETLDLSGSHMSTLPSDWLSDLRGLWSLSLRDIGLVSLKRGDIEVLTSLTEMDISRNKLRELDDNLFRGVSETIDSIDLSHNHVKVIPQNLFAEHTSLKRLYLNNNQLYSIETGAFKHVLDLEEIRLQNNKLYYLPSDVFKLNINIRLLDLSSNIFDKLPVDIFKTNVLLSSLNLADNRIDNIVRSINVKIPSLQVLNVNFNPLQCNCDLFKLREFLENADIVGKCKDDQHTVIIVHYMQSSDTCSYLSTTLAHSLFPSVSLINGIVPDMNRNSLSGSENRQSFSVSSLSSIRLYHDSTFKNEDVLSTIVHIEGSVNSLEDSFLSTYNNKHDSVTVNTLVEHLSEDHSASSANSDAERLHGLWLTSVYDNDGQSLSSHVLTDKPHFITKTTVGVSISPTAVMSNDTGHDVINSVMNHNDSNITSLNIVTSSPEEKLNRTPEEEATYFYLSLVTIIAIAVIAALVMGYMYYKRLHSNVYEVTRPSEMDIDTFINGVETRESQTINALKEVPSIQIESVDDDGNVNVEIYPIDSLPTSETSQDQ